MFFETKLDRMIKRARESRNDSYATHPGNIPLSLERLRRFEDQAFILNRWCFWAREDYKYWEFFKEVTAHHLMRGLSSPAVVVQLDPLIIAAYTMELDCVAMLCYRNSWNEYSYHGHVYPEGLCQELVTRHSLKIGTELLAVSMFRFMTAEGYAPDLVPGPKARGVYGNFHPMIADFLTMNMAAVEATKRSVPQQEWGRAKELAQAYAEMIVGEEILPRDGRPWVSDHPTTPQWKPGVRPDLEEKKTS